MKQRTVLTALQKSTHELSNIFHQAQAESNLLEMDSKLIGCVGGARATTTSATIGWRHTYLSSPCGCQLRVSSSGCHSFKSVVLSPFCALTEAL